MNSVYLGHGIALTKTADNRKLFLPTDDQSIVPHLLLGDPWEDWITLVIQKRVHAGAIVVEIGSCVAWYTTLLGKLVGPTGHVHAFEAVPDLAQLCQRSIEINGLADRVTMNALGVWETDGYKALAICHRHRGESSFGSEAMRKDEPLEMIDVPVVSLCSYFGAYPAKWPTFIKIDAEGAEAAILRGAEPLLQGHPLELLIEWNPRMLRACGEEPSTVLAWLRSLGFKSLEITQPHGALRPVDPDRLLAADTMTELLVVR